MGFEVDEIQGSWRPLIPSSDVFFECCYGDGFHDGGFILCIDGAVVDMELGWVGVDSGDNGMIMFVEALVVDCFAVSITVKLGGKRKGFVGDF